MVPAMAGMLIGTPYDLCLGSRTSGSGTLGTGMPIWKYLPNRIITAIMGACMGIRHTEFHTGYRAYTRKALETIPFHDLANNFIFDNEALVACLEKGLLTCEITCPTIYEEDSSSIPFSKSVKYGLQCFRLAFGFLKKRISGQVHSPGTPSAPVVSVPSDPAVAAPTVAPVPTPPPVVPPPVVPPPVP